MEPLGEEATVVDYLRSYQQRAGPAQATYYRRFLLLRKFLRWVSPREGVRDPAHTLRDTAATWLRQEVGDTRLVAEYLGHADLSTVSRYAHVDRDELFDAARRLEQLTIARPEPEAPPGVDFDGQRSAGSTVGVRR